MPRYVAFLRGVMPVNATMPELKLCFESAGFTEVRTVLGSGNVVFNARPSTEAALERKAERAMKAKLARSFPAIVRSLEFIERLLEADAFAPFDLPPAAKRIVTFLRVELPNVPLPVERDGARILAASGREVFSAYHPSPKGPVFMTLIERTFGSDVTTRTWETIKKCAKA